MKKNFIRTTDANTKKMLFELGYNLISEDGNVAMFLNDKPMNFAETSDMKYSYTNNLSI